MSTLALILAASLRDTRQAWDIVRTLAAGPEPTPLEDPYCLLCHAWRRHKPTCPWAMALAMYPPDPETETA